MSGRRKDAPAEEAARLYRLGLTMTEIAGVYQVSAWTIASRLDQAGVARRARDGHAVLPVGEAVQRYRTQPDRLAELAAELGISAQLITGRAQRPGRGRSGLRRDRADVPASEVADLYRAGWTVTQIAASYRTAASTVLRRLDDAGGARRTASVRVRFPVEEAGRRVRQDGVSFAQLARDYHVGVDAVRRQLSARGIRPPRQRAPRALRGVPPAQIASLYATGLTMAEIGRRFEVSRNTVGARLRAAGVTPRRVASRPRTTPIPVLEAAAKYRQGASLTKLAGAYQVTGRTLRSTLVAAGVAIRPPGGARIPIPVEEAARRYAAGQTMRQLAQRYGVCETVIYSRLTEAGIPLRRRTDRKQVDAALLARLAQQAGLDAAP
jgi:uncharacterized protein (DUF433 family)